MPPEDAVPALARLVDFSFSSGGDQHPVYLDDCSSGCGPPDPGLARLIDIAGSSGGDIPVFAQVTPCQKDWVEAEEYVNHDTGGLTVLLSKEITLLVTGMEDCTLDAAPCPTADLVHDATVDRWLGDLVLNNGTASFEFYGVFNGVSVDWYIDLDGCLASSGGAVTAPVTPECDWPPRWTAIGGGGPFGEDCCLAAPPPSIMYLLAKIPPIHIGRLVDVVVTSGGSIPVYAYCERCDLCVGSQGCCPGVPVDDQIVYTIFNVVNTTPGCACSGPALVGAPRTDSCDIWAFTSSGCTTPQTCCLTCVAGDVGDRSWTNYRLLVESVLYEPTSGSCDPLSVTFDNIPWNTADPGGACAGTVSITATRP